MHIGKFSPSPNLVSRSGSQLSGFGYGMVHRGVGRFLMKNLIYIVIKGSKGNCMYCATIDSTCMALRDKGLR